MVGDLYVSKQSILQNYSKFECYAVSRHKVQTVSR